MHLNITKYLIFDQQMTSSEITFQNINQQSLHCTPVVLDLSNNFAKLSSWIVKWDKRKGRPVLGVQWGRSSS